MSLRDNYIFDLDENVTRIPVSYKNRFGTTIAPAPYRPNDFDKSREHAAVIVGAPYGGVKEQGPGIYAQNMALRGSVALTFDPSFNGYSGGEPRHLSSPDIFVEDFSAAVDYLGTRRFVDRERIGVIGMCGSGALSLSATQVDRRIKAVAPVVMYDRHRLYAEGFENSLTDEQRIAFIDERLEQRYADFESDVPLLTPRDAPIGFDENTDPIAREFGAFYSTSRGSHPARSQRSDGTRLHHRLRRRPRTVGRADAARRQARGRRQCAQQRPRRSSRRPRRPRRRGRRRRPGRPRADAQYCPRRESPRPHRRGGPQRRRLHRPAGLARQHRRSLPAHCAHRPAATPRLPQQQRPLQRASGARRRRLERPDGGLLLGLQAVRHHARRGRRPALAGRVQQRRRPGLGAHEHGWAGRARRPTPRTRDARVACDKR